MLGSVDDTLHQHRLRAIILEELLHLGWEVLRTVTADCVDAHRLRQRDEVGIMHPRVRVPSVVEQICVRTRSANSGKNGSSPKSYI